MAKGESPPQTQASHTRCSIVDDERSLRFSIGEWARDSGFHAIEAATGREALERAARARRSTSVLLDLKLGDEDGLDVLQRLREEDPALVVVMLTGHGNVEHAVQRHAPRAPTTSCSSRPTSTTSAWCSAGALEHARLQREVEHLRLGTLGEQALLGDSAGLQARAAAARQGGAQQRQRDRADPRRDRSGQGADGPLPPRQQRARRRSVRRAQLQRDPRAAAGERAVRPREGRVHRRQALPQGACSSSPTGGTLFLDEIGEMAPRLQAKLLRVLETRTFRRVGGHADITRRRAHRRRHPPRPAQAAWPTGRFREDLYFRLNVVPIEMPPLRERADDIALLAEHFIAALLRASSVARRPRLHPWRAPGAGSDYAWPGNVRELQQRDRARRAARGRGRDPARAPAGRDRRRPIGRPRRAAAERAPGRDPFPAGVVRPLGRDREDGDRACARGVRGQQDARRPDARHLAADAADQAQGLRDGGRRGGARRPAEDWHCAFARRSENGQFRRRTRGWAGVLRVRRADLARSDLEELAT